MVPPILTSPMDPKKLDQNMLIERQTAFLIHWLPRLANLRSCISKHEETLRDAHRRFFFRLARRRGLGEARNLAAQGLGARFRRTQMGSSRSRPDLTLLAQVWVEKFKDISERLMCFATCLRKIDVFPKQRRHDCVGFLLSSIKKYLCRPGFAVAACLPRLA